MTKRSSYEKLVEDNNSVTYLAILAHVYLDCPGESEEEEHAEALLDAACKRLGYDSNKIIEWVDDGEPDPAPEREYRATFRASFVRRQLDLYHRTRSRDGQPFAVVRVITEPDGEHDAEALPMYVVRFDDGEVIEAWPEEVRDDA